MLVSVSALARKSQASAPTSCRFVHTTNSARRRVRPSSRVSASLIGVMKSNAIKLPTCAADVVVSRPLLLSGIGFEALPPWDQKNDSVQSHLHAGRAKRCRDKRLLELVPLTSAKDAFRRKAELLLSARCKLESSCFHWRDLPCPPKVSSVAPHTVQDHGKPSRQRHDCFPCTSSPGDIHGPSLQPRPFCDRVRRACAAS